MARTTIDDVKAVLPTVNTLTDSQICQAIGAATCQVDQIADGCASHLTDSCLKQVETYLAAHYAAVTDNSLNIKSEKTPCGGSATYGFIFGEGVKGTPFGVAANDLSNGCLAELGKRPANMFAIGCR